MEIYNTILKDKLLENGITEDVINAVENEDIFVSEDVNDKYENAIEETCSIIEKFAYSEIW